MTQEQLSEFDYVFCIDTSGSMSTRSTRFEGKNRLQEGEELVQGLAQIIGQIDVDGLTLITFGQGVNLYDGVTADKVHDVFEKIQVYGTTPTAKALEKAVEKAKASSKKTVCFVLTDGQPDSMPAVEKVIVDQANSQTRDEDFTFCFLQVGDDPGATEFLRFLDDDLQKRGAKFDIVDTIPAHEAATITPAQLVEKAIND